jgi:hypothetical protein
VVTAEEIAELGFFPTKITKTRSIFFIANEGNVLTILINLNNGIYKINYNDKEISKGKVSSINELEEEIQNGEY